MGLKNLIIDYRIRFQRQRRGRNVFEYPILALIIQLIIGIVVKWDGLGIWFKSTIKIHEWIGRVGTIIK